MLIRGGGVGTNYTMLQYTLIAMAACLVALSVLVPVAYAQVDTQLIYGPDANDDDLNTLYAPDQNDRFIELSTVEHTNIDAFGGIRHSSYDIQYITAEIRIHNVHTSRIAQAQQGEIIAAPGFTMDNIAIEITGSDRRYLSWACGDEQVISRNSNSATNIEPNRSTPEFFKFLPYMRVITEIDDNDENITRERCIAPEGLEINPRYDRSGGPDPANPGGAPLYDPVPAYTAPTGWSIDQDTIDNINIRYPADGASIVLNSTTFSASGNNPIIYGDALTSEFIGTITYHEDGDHTGNAIAALSTTCTGVPASVVVGDNTPLIGNEFCERPHMRGLGPIAPRSAGGGGDSGNIDQSRPHFGKSPLKQNQLVSCGFSMDGTCRDVMEYHTEYQRQTIQAGTTHDFTLKPYSNYPLQMLQLGFGIEEVGAPINTAEALIVVELSPDFESDTGYAIESVDTQNNLENVIDVVDESNISLSTESCIEGIEKDCLVVHINDVMFRDVFYSEPFVIEVVDTKRLSSTNYLNEGLAIVGKSLNAPPEYTFHTGKKIEGSNVQVLDLVRTDKVKDIWTDNNGNTWTQNDHDAWLQLTRTPYVEPKDSTMSVMTRINNNFDELVRYEAERAVLVWDSSSIQSTPDPAFSYQYNARIDKLNDPEIIQKMQSEAAKALYLLEKDQNR